MHRDVKPSNILILHRRPGDLFIKFADFGISREGDALKTICGTYVYLAPEVYEAKANGIPWGQRAAYTALIDVWSLGIFFAELLCGLPAYRKDQIMGVEWCWNIREKVKAVLRSRHGLLLSFVLDLILCLAADARLTAADCFDKALLLRDHSDDRGGPAIHSYSDGPDTKASTILTGSSSLSRYIVTTDNLGRRLDRSRNAPSPETVAAAPVHAGQLLLRLLDPEDSMFYKSSFGEDEDSDCSTSAALTVVIAREVVKPDGPQARLSEAPIREALANALREMPGGGARTTLSVKRSRAAR